MLYFVESADRLISSVSTSEQLSDLSWRRAARFGDCLLDIPRCCFTPLLMMLFIYAHMFLDAIYVALTTFDDDLRSCGKPCSENC